MTLSYVEREACSAAVTLLYLRPLPLKRVRVACGISSKSEANEGEEEDAKGVGERGGDLWERCRWVFGERIRRGRWGENFYNPNITHTQ